jgi:glycosyltransferase involved in cell wall biosynthesis
VARPAKKRIKPGIGYAEAFNAGLTRTLQGVLTTLAHMIAFPWVLIRSGASIVHVCGVSYWPFWENAYYISVSRLLGYRVTLHYLGALDLFYASCGRIVRALVKMVLRWPHRVILLSEKARALAATFLPTVRLSVIPSNVDISQFDRSDRKPPAKDDMVRVLFVGGVDPFRKGVFDLLDAAVIAVKTNPNIRFVMSGGDSFLEVKGRWQELGLDDYIEFVGWIPEDQKAKIYLWTCWCFLLTMRDCHT